jgi:hypothetical protein
MVCYRELLTGGANLPAIRTRDLDLMVNIPPTFNHKRDIPSIMADLGFLIEFKGREGFIRLVHPDLIIEFLVPERGRGSSTPYDLPALG